ncbi:MAG: hypothetical protein HKN43_08630 [Rhodothermales bacterium]|nr:hypothetical protein [Rhodothermales bacterium]
MSRALLSPFFLLVVLCPFAFPQSAVAQSFEERVIDVGNVGITITNAGFVGEGNVRNNPTGPPSFEYPLDSGVEHLFEAGLWVGAVRSDGVITVRTAAQTSSGGYAPGAAGYEFAQSAPIFERSTLPERDAFTVSAISHQDYLSSMVDTATVLPGTLIEMPDIQGQLGMKVNVETYAWNFPFTEYFAILNFDIINISSQNWDSVFVGMLHDIVVRNVNTTTDAGGAFFNKNGIGFIDSLNASYGFNAGGAEETINTYGAMVFLGAEWLDPSTGQRRYFHPDVAEEYISDGYAAPFVNPRWWSFSGGTAELSRPGDDQAKYERMSTPFPNPDNYPTAEEFEQAQTDWYDRLRTDGQISLGNWIGLTPVGPFPTVAAGDTLQVTFALVAALKPEEFQGQTGKIIDNAESQALLANNIFWAERTYSGEDNNRNGKLDPGEDVNSNGRLDRYLIPEPPPAPQTRVVFESTTGDSGQQQNRVIIYWDRSPEVVFDPVSGRQDFEGYRIYRSNPGDDQSGNILDEATIIAQYDRVGNRTGFNNGFDDVLLSEPVVFPDDTTSYWYRFEAENLLNGWQYLFTVTSFDEGDVDAGLPSFESSRVSNATRVFPGSPAAANGTRKVGVYPNPYRVNAAWDGSTNRTRKLNFYNLPAEAEVRIYTLAGEIVSEFDHSADDYTGDIRWYDNFSADNRVLPGGEHSWDILSENGLNIAGGLYLYSVRDKETGDIQKGKFVIIK